MVAKKQKLMKAKSDEFYYTSPVESVPPKRSPIKFQLARLEMDSDFFKKYFSPEHEGFKSMRLLLNRREYTAGETGISSRILSHWADKRILPEGSMFSGDKVDWKKFSTIEMVWLRAVEKMREFGLSLEKIAKVRTWVMQWHKESESYPWFEYFVIKSQYTAEDFSIVILADGTAEVASSYDLEVDKFMEEMSRHVLLISLKSIMKEIRFGSSVPPQALRSLSQGEINLVKEARTRVNKEVKATVRDGEIREIETVQNYPESPDVSEITKELQESGAYAEVIQYLGDGGVRGARVRQRRRQR
ncbi:MAG: DNA-directed polymerase subunit beta [Parcubacteria group bacterium]|nr:DNA-directed polymerase subunit beta [Parcubacteria group bacterium]